MRFGEFIGTARMVSIYGRKYDVMFKYMETNSSGQNSHGLPRLKNKKHHQIGGV